MRNFVRRHPLITILIVLNCIVMGVIAGFFIVKSTKTATLDILVAPEAATVTINGKIYENGMYQLAPGDYTVHIEQSGLVAKEFSLKLDDGGFSRLHSYLVDSAGSFAYYEAHDDDALLLERIVQDSSDGADKAAKQFLKAYKTRREALASLPITYDEQADNGFGFIYLYIDHGDRTVCKQKLEACLVINDTTGGNYNLAIDLLRERGFKVADYEIVYQAGGKKE